MRWIASKYLVYIFFNKMNLLLLVCIKSNIFGYTRKLLWIYLEFFAKNISRVF